ncbi:histidine kinase [Streptomyces sp. NPDC048611]|uniref:sensor histidine kinase n=1 Tax=Streptomyces sp. NPDC048611 TaxID=3155635 RepID=UPI003424B2EE
MRLTGLQRHALRWVHLVIGGAILVPYFLVASVVLSMVRGTGPYGDIATQFLAFGLALPPAWAAGLVFAPARSMATGAVRTFYGVPRELLADEPGYSWTARRRTALWYLAHNAAGGIVSGMSLAAPPAAVGLLALPFSTGLQRSFPGWQEAFPGVLGPLAGLALLALLAGTTWGAGQLMARLAPVLLGPTPADRLAAAERRAADLATRNRLARELHDSVGHALSAVTLQASAARRVLDTDPEFARQALAAIEDTTRDAVAELDTVLGLLREEDGGDPTAPAPTLDALEALLERTRAAGVRIETTVQGRCTGLPPVVSREAYRIVQEGLSNALRHAGPVPVELSVHRTERELTLRMENPVSGPVAGPSPGSSVPAPRTGGGRGLLGIAERARLLGGEAAAGAHDGVWRLTVRLPLAGRERGARGAVRP